MMYGIRGMWEGLYDYFEQNDLHFMLAVYHVFYITVFWVLAGLFLYVDFKGKPEWILKLKLQPTKNVPVELPRVIQACKTVLINQTVVSLPLAAIFFRLQLHMGGSCDLENLPSLLTMARDIVITAAVDGVLFYYGHRLLHHPLLYKRIHKIHHQWTAPIGLVSEYAHPFEHVIGALIPYLITPALLGSHLVTVLVWIAMANFYTICHHSGYRIPVFPDPHAHDFHHQKFNCNYGDVNLDRLHGTDALYREHLEALKEKEKSS